MGLCASERDHGSSPGGRGDGEEEAGFVGGMEGVRDVLRER